MLFLAEYDFYIEILCSKRLDIYIYIFYMKIFRLMSYDFGE